MPFADVYIKASTSLDMLSLFASSKSAILKIKALESESGKTKKTSKCAFPMPLNNDTYDPPSTRDVATGNIRWDPLGTS